MRQVLQGIFVAATAGSVDLRRRARHFRFAALPASVAR